jgi:hypothetical protein
VDDQELEEVRRRVHALRERAIQFRNTLGDLVAPLKGLMAELDEIEAAVDEEADRGSD